ncbi:FecCD family ABC transporter permease [Alteromonas flava]|uniref:FecCD family ABC transporter permease n=1 Tax=Alteromonas flava TaxID=2048003 RepID=UPI000C29081A|nr:iron ABC transporter permease [Alteromonas flava]
MQASVPSSTDIIGQHQRMKLRDGRYLLLGFIAIAPLAILWALSSGAYHIGLWELISTQGDTAFELAILLDIRLPRVLMTVSTGAGLAVCGLTLQALTRNPLADPGLLGVSACAALFAGISMLISSRLFAEFGAPMLFTPAMAFAGAAVAMLALIAISRRNRGSGNLLLILAGVAVNAAAMTCLGLVTFIADDQTLRQITFWSMGSYAGSSWPMVWLTSITVVFCLVYLFKQRYALMQLSCGEQQARCQGVNVALLKRKTLLVCAAIIAVCVSFTGIVGFVGLVVPHICRLLLGGHLGRLMPVVAIVGGLLVTIADTLARTLIVPAELPVGLLTSTLGVPFFIYLIWHQQSRGQHV